jgi:hypothetical protein
MFCIIQYTKHFLDPETQRVVIKPHMHMHTTVSCPITVKCHERVWTASKFIIHLQSPK